jgi:uncharacterized membrane protein
MKSIEEQLKEISRRKKRYENARKSMVFAMAGGCLLMSLIAVISIAPGTVAVSGQSKTTVLGSTILDAKTGGYVLAALIGFTLGVFVTLFCRQYRANQADRNTDAREK